MLSMRTNQAGDESNGASRPDSLGIAPSTAYRAGWFCRGSRRTCGNSHGPLSLQAPFFPDLDISPGIGLTNQKQSSGRSRRWTRRSCYA